MEGILVVGAGEARMFGCAFELPGARLAVCALADGGHSPSDGPGVKVPDSL